MSRLRAPSHRVPLLTSRIAPAFEVQRNASPSLHNLYKTAEWQSLRWKVLVRDRFTCQRSDCHKRMRNTSLLVADHIRPHRGDLTLFWSEANLQTLCKPCHDRIKQQEESAWRARGGGFV